MVAGGINWLIEGGRYDLQFHTTDGAGACQKMKDVEVATLGRRVKMDCSIPINSIPRCSAIAEG